MGIARRVYTSCECTDAPPCLCEGEPDGDPDDETTEDPDDLVGNPDDPVEDPDEINPVDCAPDSHVMIFSGHDLAESVDKGSLHMT